MPWQGSYKEGKMWCMPHTVVAGLFTCAPLPFLQHLFLSAEPPLLQPRTWAHSLGQAMMKDSHACHIDYFKSWTRQILTNCDSWHRQKIGKGIAILTTGPQVFDVHMYFKVCCSLRPWHHGKANLQGVSIENHNMWQGSLPTILIWSLCILHAWQQSQVPVRLQWTSILATCSDAYLHDAFPVDILACKDMTALFLPEAKCMVL